MRGVPLLNFEGGPWFPVSNSGGGSRVPLLKFRGGLRSRSPEFRGPGPTFTRLPFVISIFVKISKIEHVRKPLLTNFETAV